jgi:hypothetical protein
MQNKIYDFFLFFYSRIPKSQMKSPKLRRTSIMSTLCLNGLSRLRYSPSLPGFSDVISAKQSKSEQKSKKNPITHSQFQIISYLCNKKI